MEWFAAFVLFTVFVINIVQGNDVSLSDVVLWSEHWGDSCHRTSEGVTVYRVSPNERARLSATLTVNGKLLDLWWTLRWKGCFESATRSHMCPCDCGALHIPGQCCHTDICSGEYPWKPYEFTVPDFECGICTFIDLIYWGDWYTDKCNNFCKTYDVHLGRLNVEVRCPQQDCCCN